MIVNHHEFFQCERGHGGKASAHAHAESTIHVSFARPFNRLEDPSHAESAAYTKQATILAANVPTWKPPTSAMDELAYRSPVPTHPPRNTTVTTSSRIICLFKCFSLPHRLTLSLVHCFHASSVMLVVIRLEC